MNDMLPVKFSKVHQSARQDVDLCNVVEQEDVNNEQNCILPKISKHSLLSTSKIKINIFSSDVNYKAQNVVKNTYQDLLAERQQHQSTDFMSTLAINQKIESDFTDSKSKSELNASTPPIDWLCCV